MGTTPGRVEGGVTRGCVTGGVPARGFVEGTLELIHPPSPGFRLNLIFT